MGPPEETSTQPVNTCPTNVDFQRFDSVRLLVVRNGCLHELFQKLKLKDAWLPGSWYMDRLYIIDDARSLNVCVVTTS